MNFNNTKVFKRIPLFVALAAAGFNLNAAPATGISFVDSGQALGAGTTVRTALVDIDADGDLDALTVNYGQNDKVWLNDGTGTFSDSGQNIGGARYNWDLCTGDIDADGDLDVGYALWGNAASEIYSNDGTGLLTVTSQALASEVTGGCELGDLDGDGDLDLYMFGGYGNPDRVYLNDGSGNFINTNQSLDTNNSYGGELSDLDGDGDLDAIVANASTSSPNTIYLNDGTGTFTDSGQVAGTTAAWNVEAADIDADGDNDIVATDSSGSSRIYINNGAAVFTDSGQVLSVPSGNGLATGDLDGDGDLDIVIGAISGTKVFENDGTGTFSDTGIVFGANSTRGVTLADLDGDGDLDLFESVYDASGPNKVWLNGSKGVVQFSAESYSVSEADGSITITVSRSNGANGAATIDYAVADDSAVSPADYSATSGTLSWADGETGDRTFTISVAADTETEADETISLSLSNAVGAGLGVQSTATLNLLDAAVQGSSNTDPVEGAEELNSSKDGYFGIGSVDSLLILSLLSLIMLRSRERD